MSNTRMVFGTIFVAWPILVLIKMMGLVRRPLIALFDLFGKGDQVGQFYAFAGIKLFYWSVRGPEGKEAAGLAVVTLILDSLCGPEGE